MLPSRPIIYLIWESVKLVGFEVNLIDVLGNNTKALVFCSFDFPPITLMSSFPEMRGIALASHLSWATAVCRGHGGDGNPGPALPGHSVSWVHQDPCSVRWEVDLGTLSTGSLLLGRPFDFCWLQGWGGRKGWGWGLQRRRRASLGIYFLSSLPDGPSQPFVYSAALISLMASLYPTHPFVNSHSLNSPENIVT